MASALAPARLAPARLAPARLAPARLWPARLWPDTGKPPRRSMLGGLAQLPVNFP
ncbi:MAG: hypothetical protein ACKOJF_32810 [Planctomycetaceae bacterium]